MPHRPTHIAPTYNTGTNACGRLLRVDDGTGYQLFAYDRLGNVAENIRAIALPFEDSVYNFRMLYEYDSWNRVQRIVYPDSEVVSYSYDLGGQLYSVSTFKNNVSSSLINSILYDEFGHRTQVNFGNGVTTNYTYDILQRLSLLETQKPGSPALQKISYTFDNEDNITRVANSTAPVNGIGGGYIFDYQYDNLYRLTSSTGNFTPTNASYYLEMDFTPAGRVCRKEQGDNNNSKRLLYGYNPNNAPHAARRIYDPSTGNLRQMLWDANGNLAQIAEYTYDPATEITTLQDFRNHYWDDDDRLNLVLDNSHFSYYLYGHDGQRVAKLTSDVVQNSSGYYGFSNSATIKESTLYLSEYMVSDKSGYTKYYYADGTRIAARWGEGGFEKMQRLCTKNFNLYNNASALFHSVVARIGEDMPQELGSAPCLNYAGNNDGFNVLLPTLNFEAGFFIVVDPICYLKNGLRTNRSEETYYFHGNHLGSANWVTTATSAPTQFLLHLPYGEEFVKQLSGSYDERFTFTGKEKDIETGYYYFGARFDNVDLGFMSVDPMADKYPSISPYAYCAWNPVKLVDPEGEDWKDVDGNIIKDHSKIKVYIFYDPVSFSEQSLAMYNDAIEKYGHGTVALSDATTEKDFAQDWQNMESNDIREINLNYHGSNQALYLDYKNEEYITSTGDGLTNKNFVQGLDITELPSIKGNIKNAQLNINSCHSNKKDENLRGSKQTLMESFYKNFKFKKVRGTSHGVSYSRFTKRPHPGHNWLNHLLEWEYLPKIKVKVNTNTSDYIGTRR